MTDEAPSMAPCPGCNGEPCDLLPGYPWCRPCREHHRPPECPIDELGRSLSGCGCPWEDIEYDDGIGHRADCPWNE